MESDFISGWSWSHRMGSPARLQGGREGRAKNVHQPFDSSLVEVFGLILIIWWLFFWLACMHKLVVLAL